VIVTGAAVGPSGRGAAFWLRGLRRTCRPLQRAAAEQDPSGLVRSAVACRPITGPGTVMARAEGWACEDGAVLTGRARLDESTLTLAVHRGPVR
jgi:hypothetical protein